jgi:hypothetical protein
MLIHGQLLSVAVALACAGLAQALWRHWAAALATLIVVGLVSIMPAYYVSWGRYTLLTGMLMLPAALILLREVAQRRSSGALLAAALVLAGLSLVHFVVFVFALAWCIALICTQVWPTRRSLALACARLALAGLLMLAATAPWIALLAAQVRSGTGASAMHLVGNSDYNAMPYTLLWTSTNKLLAGLAGCGALLGLLRHRAATVQVTAWSLVIVLLTNLPMIGLPYISFLTNEIVAVTMFLPLALLIGVGAGMLARRAGLQARPGAASRRQLLALAGFLALSAWGAWQLQHVVRADTILATNDDLDAIAWASASTPPDARFVVNTVGWLGDVDRGADGGWWLLPLAGRAVSTPPVVYTYGPDAYVERVKQETAWLRSAGQVSDADLAAWMRAHDYRYVYATHSGTTLNRERLSASLLFEQVYANQSVAIFALRP